MTGCWVRACYRAEKHVIAERYEKWEVAGELEVSRVDVAGFSPRR